MPRLPKVDVHAVTDAALADLSTLFHVLHPMAIQQVQNMVHKLLTDLGQSKAADRWAGVSSEKASG